MGLLESDQTLAETLFEVGGTAATHDERYAPLEAKELDDLEIHVTVLSKFEKLKSSEDLTIGTHGVAITRGKEKAILLPHVAVDEKWSAEKFLEAACEKAQLSHKAWKDKNTLVERFTVLDIEGGKLMPLIEEYTKRAPKTSPTQLN
jgi:AmmeMemoRadiSam system protein A